MKIVISIIILGSLIFLVKKFSAKKPAEQIGNETTEDAGTDKTVTDSGNNNPADSESKTIPTQLDTDKASLAALQNDAGYKDVLRRIGILQGQNKWGVKDEGGFYYSADNAGVVFSGGNSTDEYNTMLQQQTDYNTKVAALTKSITDAEGTAAQPAGNAANETTNAVSSLEIPLEIKLIISAIKSKFSLDNATEQQENTGEEKDTDTDEENYNNNTNYNGSNNSGSDNGGGGGGSNNNNPYPYQYPNAVVTPAGSIIPTGSVLANILSLPIKQAIIPHKLNVLPFNITPTPTPVINTNNLPVSSERQAQPSNQRHSGHYYHTRRTH